LDDEKILVVIPYRKGEIEQATKAADIHKSRAGMPVQVYLMEDEYKEGWVAMQNWAARNLNYDYLIYSCDDYFPGINYVKIAYDTLQKTGKGLCVFNDGKWYGHIATAGLISRKLIEKLPYDMGLFSDDYKQNYGDTELTDVTIHLKEIVYNPDAVLMEIDYEKESKPHLNMKDKLTYRNKKVEWVKHFD